MRRIVTHREQAELATPWQRTAEFDPYAVTTKLKGEFEDWHKPDHPASASYSPDKWNSGMGHWPVVEHFLKDRYPAAHRGLQTGREDASTLLDAPEYAHTTSNPSAAPYASEDHQKLGYDPSEVAAGMVLLHNQRRDGFGNGYMEEDKDRLVDIFNKRQKMQRDFDQRTATPWESKPGDPTYQVPTGDLIKHRQFNPAITTPEQMSRALYYQPGDPSTYKNDGANFSSGGGSEGSHTDEHLVDAFESGQAHKLPPTEIVTNGYGATLSDGNHRAEVADMMSHPELSSYIHYDPHSIPDDFHTAPVDPESALGKHIHQLVQNHPYEPVDGGPTTDHVFRRHPETGEWQRGRVDHSSPPHFVDDEDYAQQMTQSVPGYKHDGLGTYFDVDWGNGPEITHERHMHARREVLAMPTYYHYTREPDFQIDHDRRPDNAVLDRELPHGGKGLWVSPDKDHWKNYRYRGPRTHLVELHSDDELNFDSSEGFVGGDQLKNMQVKSVTPKSGGA